jgi:hypothetical protein
MPHGFEYVVRPFGSPDSQNSTIIPATPKGTRERAHLSWGAKGTMPFLRFTGVDFNTQKRKKEVELTEEDRDSDLIRIEQPGKPENYVDVARAKKVKLGLEEKETEPDNLAQRQYVASGIDPRLDPYKPAMSSPPGNATTLTTGKETWAMKNQQ